MKGSITIEITNGAKDANYLISHEGRKQWEVYDWNGNYLAMFTSLKDAKEYVIAHAEEWNWSLGMINPVV